MTATLPLEAIVLVSFHRDLPGKPSPESFGLNNKIRPMIIPPIASSFHRRNTGLYSVNHGMKLERDNSQLLKRLLLKLYINAIIMPGSTEDNHSVKSQ